MMRRLLRAATRRLPPSFPSFTALGVWVGAALLARPPLALWLAVAAPLLAPLALSARAARARGVGPSLRFLTPMGFRTAMAAAEVMLPRDAVLTPEEVARSLDKQCVKLAMGPGQDIRRGLIVLRFAPLLRGQAPLDLMSAARRRLFLERRLEAIAAHRVGEPLRRVEQALVRLAHQATVIGYYTDPRARAAHGYVALGDRTHHWRARSGTSAGTSARTLAVDGPAQVGESIATDLVVVGSGAGGAIAAYRLAERGRSVVVLERGPHVRAKSYTENEAEMLGRLFGPGSRQVSRDFRLQVLQGCCVGGSTVVNNGVCFDLPVDVLREWNDPAGCDAGLDERLLAASFARVRQLIGVRSQDAAPHSGAARKLERGVRALGLDRAPYRFAAFDANIADCIGCGLCNIGCAYGAKQSMLESVLPLAQRRFGDRVRIVAEADVVRIRRRGTRATGVDCRLSDGRKLRVAAETVVVAAGALHSSALLQRSGLGGRAVGRSLTHNLAFPLMAEFGDEVNSFDGLQMTHYLAPPPGGGFIIESWAQPIAAHASALGGWFEQHFETMRRYPYVAAAGVVVGTERGGSWVRYSPLARRPTFAFAATRRDVVRLVVGTRLLGEVFFAAGARRLIPSTYRGRAIDSPAQLARLGDGIRDGSDLMLRTSHPQGGNAVSRTPAKGVVDERLTVHGTDNVHVCDASTFPTSITVNPQLTVMAMADYAAALL
jgi:choline dehydrogenase-like flavoprotein